MDSLTLLSQAHAAGLEVCADGDLLVVRGPRSAEALAQTLLAHKAELMPLLTAPQTPAREHACLVCGGSDWRETPDAGRWCLPCMVAGREPVAAVKVHSAVLDTELSVVADDLPRELWPQDGTVVYTHQEVRVLRQAKPDELEWVQLTKELFDATVLHAGPRKPKGMPPGTASDHEVL